MLETLLKKPKITKKPSQNTSENILIEIFICRGLNLHYHLFPEKSSDTLKNYEIIWNQSEEMRNQL